jgi:hypothetical protein
MPRDDEKSCTMDTYPTAFSSRPGGAQNDKRDVCFWRRLPEPCSLAFMVTAYNTLLSGIAASYKTFDSCALSSA